jgi:hypothetical protein
MTEQQQFEIMLKHLQRCAAGVEQLNATILKIAIAITELDATLNEVIIQGKSGRPYLSTVVRKSPE